MANTFDNTLNKVGTAIEAIFGTKRAKTPIVYNQNGQSCLEKFGMETRNEHLFRNEWKRDLQYTKALVDAEYQIQTEFTVSSYQDRLTEEADKARSKEKELTEKKIRKLEEKKQKRQQEIDDINEKLEGLTKPKENLSNS